MDAINAICFDWQKQRMARTDNEGWSLEKLEIIEGQYRKFLYLWKKYPEKNIPPSNDVDVFWHNHILDTEKYQKDCLNVFGYYKHHFPYFGIRGEDDRQALLTAFEETLSLYQKEFGEMLYEVVDKQDGKAVTT